MADSGAGPSPPEPRGSAGLLADGTFGPFFVGKVLSSAGFWTYSIVAAILVFELSGSAFVVGLVSVAQFGPQLVLAPLSGAVADRVDRRHLLLAGRLLVAAAAGAMAAWIWLVGVDGLPGAWPIVLTAGLTGIGYAVGGPAENAMIPALVRPGELAPAVALNAIPPVLARAAGPAVGAFVTASLGPAAGFAIASAANLVFCLVVLGLRIRSHPQPASGSDRRIRAGLLHLRTDRVSLLLLTGVAAIGVGADPVVTLTPSLAAGFGQGSTLVGLLASAFGVGAGAAFFVLGALRRRLGLPRLATMGLMLIATGIAMAGLSPSSATALSSLLVGGFGMTLALTSLTTQLQERLPDEVRGRVMALWLAAWVGSRPLAAAVNGAVADATAPAVAFVLVGVVVGGVAWLCRPDALSAREPGRREARRTDSG